MEMVKIVHHVKLVYGDGQIVRLVKSIYREVKNTRLS
jgi:hypothetical protein